MNSFIKLNQLLIIFLFIYNSLFSTSVNGSTVVLVGKNNEIPPRAGLDSDLLNFIMELKRHMHVEIPFLGLPILEPFKLEHLDVDLENEIGIIKGFMDNFKLEGLAELHPNKVSLKLAGLVFYFDINFPELKLSGLYNIDGLMGGLFPIYGDGSFEVTVKNMRIIIDGKLKFTNQIWSMPNLTIALSIDEINANFKGLYGGNNEYEDFVNQALSELGPQILDELWPDFEPTLSNQAREIIIDAIQDMEIGEIIEIIQLKRPVFPELP